jgi:fatty acid desaturase
LDAPVGTPHEDSIADLVGRLIEDGRDVARAEANLYKQIALRRAARAKAGAVALLAAALLFWFAAIALIFGLVLGLAVYVGPVAAGAILAVLLGIGGYVLLRYGLKGLQALSGDEEERAALKKGEAGA